MMRLLRDEQYRKPHQLALCIISWVIISQTLSHSFLARGMLLLQDGDILDQSRSHHIMTRPTM